MPFPPPRPPGALRRRLRARAAAWVRRRQGDDVLPLAILQRRVYILPTRAGLAFALLLFVMLLAGLNYANGLALLLTFTLGGFALVAMHLCHRNLLGTVVSAAHAGTAFAGEEAVVEFTLENPGALMRRALRGSLEGALPGAPVDLEPGASATLRLRLPVPRRGRVRIERVRIDTAFPFGLFEAWTWLHLPLEVIVYPAARGERRPPERAGARVGSHSVHGPGVDEWSSLRAFRAGDSPRTVAWKAYARGAPLLVKEYSSAGAADLSLDYAALAHLAPEVRLEQLCRWVVEAARRGDRYDLRLPGLQLEADSGLAHRERSLRALALHGEDTAAASGAAAVPAATARSGAAAGSGARAGRGSMRLSRELRLATLAPLAGYLLGVLLHLDRLPLWCTAFALGAAGWRAAATLRGGLRLPGRVLRIGLALGVVAAVALEFRTLNGLAAGTALLTVMGALKLFEMHARRDRLIVIAVGLVLLLAACLDRQNLLRVPLYVAALYVGCAALALAATPRPGFGVLAAGRLAGRSLASALPLALLLFLFFPRLAGSFWALPTADSALTGLGESMTPGDIDALTESDEPAFRVRFDGTAPPPGLRYWRGPVLHSFDGTTWRRVRGQSLPHPPLEYAGTGYRYRISIEPEKQNWVFALEKPRAPADPALLFSFDDQLLAAQPLGTVTSYEFTSYPAARSAGGLPASMRTLDTGLRPGANPRALGLGRELRAGSASDAAFVDAVLEMFRTRGFEYTLTPPKLDRDAVDDFLFRTKRGFCGHFASAFVDLMRAGGVPARVVTGYLGGEWNPLGGYYIVRQSDAHAWAEVWLEARGWTRVDPTAVVAPERLTRGLYDFMPGSMSVRERLVHDNAWITRSRLAWDATDNWWREHVEGYDFRRQLALLERLGFTAPDARTLGLAMAIALAAWLIWVGWQSRRRMRSRPRDPLTAAWARLGERLAALDLARAPHEGPLDYAARVAVRRPDLAAAVAALCANYAALRYGRPAAAGGARAAVEAFARAVERFRPARATGSLPPRAGP